MISSLIESCQKGNRMNENGFELLAIDASVLWMNTRIPFRYGIATLTELPHLFLRVRLRPGAAGEDVYGVAAEGLLPKWFDKNPETTGQQDLENMWASIGHAVSGALEGRRFSTCFGMWRDLYAEQERWGGELQFPALLWHFGVSMVERAVIDALCRHAGAPLSRLLEANAFGIEDDGIGSGDLRAVLASESLSRIAVRHTVGMGDPLTTGDLEDPIGDGLPETLEEDITAYDLRYFKIKVRGDLEPDIDRLSRIAELFDSLGLEDFWFSLDGNEQFYDAHSFREFFSAVKSKTQLTDFFGRVLFVEQPFARAIALSDELGRDLLAWKERPPIIIDESDGAMGDLERALHLGYAGSSYKNCKGVFKGLLNAARIRRQNASGSPGALLSGEDLANVGPVALLQDLAMMAKLGITHVERNGHHYFQGLSRFSRDLQESMLRHHGDLYHRQPGIRGGDDFAALKVVKGQLSTRSVNQAPFGVALIPEESEYRPFLSMDCPKMKD
jgi:L-alanine-DL-glutamate epimerase-like enolase superfamily enzyme